MPPPPPPPPAPAPALSRSGVSEDTGATAPFVAPALHRASTGSRREGLQWLDMLRIAAIGAVIVIHAIGTATRESGTGWHAAWWWGANLINSACLWCVPVFVMVSGALLLDPARAQGAPGEFLRKRAVRIGVPLVFWISVYLIFQRQFYGVDLSFSSAWHGVASGDPYLQLYFLFIVAGLTVLTPLLRRVIVHASRRELQILTGGALAFGLAEHAFRELGGGGGFNAVTRCLPYVGYYLAGYLLRTAEIKPRVARLARGTFVIAWLATAIGSGLLAARYGWTADGYFLYDYLSPTVMVMAIAIFVGARGWSPKRLTASQLRQIGAATFGVFLIHPLLLFPIMRGLGLPDTADISRTVAWALPLALTVCAACTVISLGLSRVPGVRRLIA